MSALDLDALEVLCDDATPGPWTHDQRSMVCVGADGIADDCRWDDAAFIAACDPDTIRALITRLRAAEARTADLRAGLERVAKRCAEGGEQALAEAQCALDWDDALPAAPEAP